MNYMPSTPHETEVMIFWLLGKSIPLGWSLVSPVGVPVYNAAKTYTIAPTCRQQMTKQGLPEARAFGWNACTDTIAPTQIFRIAFTLNPVQN